MIEVYHGGTEAITNPLVSAGREGLDFGKGFYVTLCANKRSCGQIGWLVSAKARRYFRYTN